MYEQDGQSEREFGHTNLVLFMTAAGLAVALFLIFHPQIDDINGDSSILLAVLFGPAMAIGFLYGVKITSKALAPSETRSPIKRSIIKTFLFFFVIGGLFSSVGFALNGGSITPVSTIFEVGLVEWATNYIHDNGGAAFLIISSIALMAAATRRIIRLGGPLNRFFTFIGTFVFFWMIVLSLTQNNPSSSQVYLFTFYQAGIIGGAFYEMNKLSRHHNDWEDYQNGY